MFWVGVLAGVFGTFAISFIGVFVLLAGTDEGEEF